MTTRSQTRRTDAGHDHPSVSSAVSRAPAKAPPRPAVLVASWLRGFFLRCADRMLPNQLAVLDHAHGFAKARILSTMAELGVADHLADGPRSAEDLASTIGCQPDALHRLLRAAAVFGAVRLDRAGRFHSTRFTDVLRSAHPSAAADWCRYIGSASQQGAWADLTESVRTGGSAFRRVHDQSTFDWFETHPDEAHRFSAGLGGLTRAEAPAIVSCYPFPKTGVICDVGGGQGVLLAEILTARPQLRGVLVDATAVLEQARSYLQARGLEQRVDLVAGDLLGRIDARADIYLLKWILHDWDDPTCLQIVRSLAATMPPGARLVVIEGDQGQDAVDPRFSMIDLQMLVVTEGGRERSADQIQAILTAGGLLPGKRRTAATGLVLVEATSPRATSPHDDTTRQP
jgi:O-methyltransferase domain/Dimerisation domain